MARIIKFDRSNHRRVLPANDEVETHTVDSVLPRLEVVPLVHPEYTRQPQLGRHNVLGQRLTQAEVEDLFRHRERLRELEWPNVFTAAAAANSATVRARPRRRRRATLGTQRLVLRGLPPPLLAGPSWSWLIRILVLGPFECEVDGHSLGTYSCKAASKPLALLRRLAVLTGYEGVSPDSVANELWPGEGREGREKVLETTLARLRKLLGSADAVLLHEH